MNARTFLKSVIGTFAALVIPWKRHAKSDEIRRPVSQWQWRADGVGTEIEDTINRVLCRCDIGRGRGTVVSSPQQHNVLHVWVDMDEDRISEAWSNRKLTDDFQSRSCAVAVNVYCVLFYIEDDLVEALQRAIIAAKRQPQVRTWKEVFGPDHPENMVNLSDHLPSMDDRRPMSAKATFNSNEEPQTI